MKQILLLLIRTYQLSRPFRPASCRFYPSCSCYAHDCIEKHGILKGAVLTIWRLLRCHPFHPGGIDYAPDAFNLSVFSLRKIDELEAAKGFGFRKQV
jgi:putative membrane protein insertion efficiency factor